MTTMTAGVPSSSTPAVEATITGKWKGDVELLITY